MKGKRKKYPRLPNGFGSIRYLGAGRRNPFAVHPPASLDDSIGDIVPQPALCYVDDYMIGVAVLTAYHAGTYKPGYELTVRREVKDNLAVEDVTRRLLADYRKLAGHDAKRPTFAEVYQRLFDDKFCEGHKYSKQTISSIKAGYKNCSQLHGREFYSLKHDDLQAAVDSCPLKYASLELIVNLLHQMYTYGLMHDLCEKDYSRGLKIKKADDDEKGVPFTLADLKAIYQAYHDQHDETAEMLLIMCLSGFRMEEYKKIQVNTDQWYFQGGSKSKAGKFRIVPIHSAIQSMVRRRMAVYGQLLPMSSNEFRRDMADIVIRLGILNIPKRTPHDCRHTFSWLCEKYGVTENDRKRMLGHSFGSDITNRVYGHRDLEELREQIEKIDTCDFYVTNGA